MCLMRSPPSGRRKRSISRQSTRVYSIAFNPVTFFLSHSPSMMFTMRPRLPASLTELQPQKCVPGGRLRAARPRPWGLARQR